jgi:hypothetical protein
MSLPRRRLKNKMQIRIRKQTISKLLIRGGEQWSTEANHESEGPRGAEVRPLTKMIHKFSHLHGSVFHNFAEADDQSMLTINDEYGNEVSTCAYAKLFRGWKS